MARSTSNQRQGSPCPRCGQRCPASAKFCALCGTALGRGQPARRSRGPWLAFGAIGVIVLLIVIGAFSDSDERTPTTDRRALAATTATAERSASAPTSEPTATASPTATGSAEREPTAPPPSETPTERLAATATDHAPPEETVSAVPSATVAPAEISIAPTTTSIPPTAAATPEPTALPTPPGGVPDDAELANVRAIVDGDTVRVTLSDGSKTTVRLIGIDAPETKDPDEPIGCYGPESAERMTNLIAPGRAIWLERDASDHDRYDRLLRYVWVEKSDGDIYLLNEVLVRDGFAFVAPYPPDTARIAQLDRAEARAQDNGRGLWTACPELAKSLLPTPTPTAIPPTQTPQPTAIPLAVQPTADTSTYTGGDGCTYRNVDGVLVPCPVRADSPPPGATAKCNDGTYSFSQNRRGTCSHHGGVAIWL